MPTIRSGDDTVAFSDTGSGAPLVLVHGWGCSRRDWDGVTDALSSRFRLIAVDLPGHGESATTSDAVSIGSYADDVAAVIDSLELGGPVTAVGHSLGGAVVLELAARRPDLVSRVIGVDTYHYLQVYPTQSEEAIGGMMSAFHTDLPAAVDGLIAMSSIPSTSAEVKESVRASTLSASFPLALTALEDSLRWDLDATLTRVDVPVSAVVSAELISDEALARYADRIDFVPFPGVSHYLLLENPEGAARHLAEAATR